MLKKKTTFKSGQGNATPRKEKEQMGASGSFGILHRYVLSPVAAESVPTSKSSWMQMSREWHLTAINIHSVTHPHSVLQLKPKNCDLDFSALAPGILQQQF